MTEHVTERASVPLDKPTLIALLREAAELEHALCCQYLYAAFTLKQGGDPSMTPARVTLTTQWSQQVTKIAIQEMLHLMLASNLLSAVGAEPHFWRPDFPQPGTRYSDVGIPSLLAPFAVESVNRFMCWEKPETPGWWDGHCAACATAARARLGAALVESLPPPPFSTIAGLYELIDAALKANPQWIDPANAGRQVTSALVPLHPQVTPITSYADAHRFIELIITEGEGTPKWDSMSHFAYFHQIYNQLAGGEIEPFAPGWPTVETPSYCDGPPRAGTSPIADPGVRAVGRLFNDVYLLMLRTLGRLFVPEGDTATDRRALADAVLALMPFAVGGLGVLLTRLPAGAAYPGKYAGPSFELPPRVAPPSGPRAQALGALREETVAIVRRCRLLALEPGDLPVAGVAQLGAVASTLETLLPLLAPPAGAAA